MKCFHETQDEIAVNPLCKGTVLIAYQRLYIQPLVEQTREVVTAHCDILPTYQQYLTASTATTPCEWHLTRTAAAAACAFALLFARWRHGLR